MTLILVCIFLPVLAATVSLAFPGKTRLQTMLGAGSVFLGSVCGLYPALSILISGQSRQMNLPWSMPLGSLSFSIDALSAFFMVPLFILSALGALYALEYLRKDRATRNPGLHWLWYNTLCASMATVLLSSNGLMFLLAWECMSLTSFFLVLYRHEEKESQEAAWIYFIATHIGTAFLLVFFLLAGSQTGSLDFSSFTGFTFGPVIASILFVTGIVGFGSKAGFVPFHVWLPRAHPAAPSHVSALMSGIMIKMGIYGIARALTFLHPFEIWWGVVMIVIGCTSGILGVLLALGQHDLKRLLAYHSVENIGIIALGIGLGMLGIVYHNPMLTVLGLAGGLLHVVNHALFKGLLFLGAGSVLHATGTAQIDSLGGLIKKMPTTAAAFLVGSIAICGLPPLNGFVSEFMIYVGGFHGLRSHELPVFLIATAAMASLALIGGLAAACFTKAFGTVFLGERRTTLPELHEAGIAMKLPMYILCVLCAIIGVGFWSFATVLTGPIALIAHLPQEKTAAVLTGLVRPLTGISIGALVFLSLVAILFFIRRRLLKNRVVAASPTWDCGYAVPNARMQYTASSFAQPIVSFFGLVLGLKENKKTDTLLFPKKWTLHTQVTDLFLDRLFVPLFRLFENVLSRLRWLQGGKVQNYVFYILLTLIVLLVWNFGWHR